MKRLAIFPGSFDPLTNGHLDILERGLMLFDDIIIVISSNEHKRTTFTLDERIALVKHSVKHLKNVKVVAHTKGLLVDVARHYQAQAILRGIRNLTDMQYEQSIALYNKREHDTLETVLLFSREEHAILSSSGIKELFRIGGNVSKLVPKTVEQALHQKIQVELLEIIE